LAYQAEKYYTHKKPTAKEGYSSLSLSRKAKRILANGYANARFGCTLAPSSSLGTVVAYALPPLKRIIDRNYRHLPRPRAGGDRLLDVGCGAGDFLIRAKACGWDAVGIEPDSSAAAQAQESGCKVYAGSIGQWADELGRFDVVTLGHVIEHVPEPRGTLETCHRLLKPRGLIWLETPNIESYGHARFGPSWVHLDPPRHLALFSSSSLKRALASAGFVGVRYCSSPSPCRGNFEQSSALAHGQQRFSPPRNPVVIRLLAALASSAGLLMPSRREFLTVTARRAAS
jgi:2-polyprenyl-3-methyl-5-hydroxy-6-metoxy-1,4-benzoquinol methylase